MISARTGDEASLHEMNRRKLLLKNRTTPAVEAPLVELSLDLPAYGEIRIANELRNRGRGISLGGAREI